MSAGVKTPAETLRKIRDMIRAGYSQAEAARQCGVSPSVALAQGKLLERFEGVNRNNAGRQAKSDRALSNKGGFSVKGLAAQGRDHDPEAMDLVDIFETPRTPAQLRRFAERD